MDLGALEGDFCDCFFNKTEVKDNGGWEKDDDSDMAAHDKDPIRCLRNCRAQFLETVSAEHSETLGSICSKLTTKGPNQNLWPLYWCDSTLCGVWIDQTVKGGQDPNVDLIINECQSYGYHSVFDPGPPPPNYTCITDANKADSSVGLCTNIQVPAQTSSAAVGTQAPPATTHTSTWDSTILATQSGAPTRATASGGVPIAAETTVGSSNSPSISATAPTRPDTELTPGTRVAIAVSSALGFLLFACLALILLRRRHKQRDSTLPSSVKNRIRYPRDFPPPGSPTTPLIPSPTTTRPPLTPPPRLRDRKFLPSILRQSRSPSPPLTPLNPVHLPPHAAAVFPSSPICSPTTNRLVPRHERTPKINGHSNASQPPSTPPASPPPLPPLPPVPAYFHDRGSLGSASTFAPSTKSTTSTAGCHSISLSSLRNETVSLLSLPPPPPPPPTSPTRPPRPHEAPLVIPDLVSPASPTAASPSLVSAPTSPAGPPPNRALPARPVMQTPVIVVDGASPSPSPEPAGPPGRSAAGEQLGGGSTTAGWVGQKIRGQGRGRERMTVDLDLGSGRR